MIRSRPAPSVTSALHRRRPLRGFTLIEVLVALFILAIMAGLAWRGIDAVVRSRDVVQQRMERLQRLQTVLAQWDADLRQVIDTQVVPGLKFDGAAMRLTRPQPDGLHRWASPTTTSSRQLQEYWMNSYQLQGNEVGSVRMLAGLAQWQLYTYYGNAWTNAQSSGDVNTDGNRSDLTALPDGVRVIFEFSPGGEADGTVTRDIRLVHP